MTSVEAGQPSVVTGARVAVSPGEANYYGLKVPSRRVLSTRPVTSVASGYEIPTHELRFYVSGLGAKR